MARPESTAPCLFDDSASIRARYVALATASSVIVAAKVTRRKPLTQPPRPELHPSLLASSCRKVTPLPVEQGKLLWQPPHLYSLRPEAAQPKQLNATER